MKILTSIVTNDEQDYIKYCLDGIYDFSDKIVIVHGEAYDTNEVDQTYTGEVIASYSDPSNKIISRYLPQSFPQKRELAFNLAVEEGFDWYMVVDADEFYTFSDLNRLKGVLEDDKDTDMFFMEYFAFCYNFSTGYWTHVTPNYPQSERIWRWQDGLNCQHYKHSEVFYDSNGVDLRDQISNKINLNDHDVMMYHMTFVKDSEKIRQRMQQRMGVKGFEYADEILLQARPDNLEEIYQKNKDLRGVYGLHWSFQNVVLSPFGGRPLPEVLLDHPRKDIEWEV
jgi:hypothetical protein